MVLIKNGDKRTLTDEKMIATFKNEGWIEATEKTKNTDKEKKVKE
jgi:hypothetical protein